MSDNAFETLEIHPLVKAQEKHHTTAVEFRGYSGTGDERVIRLYGNLEMTKQTSQKQIFLGLISAERACIMQSCLVRIYVMPV
jgi:hypothetical protein